MDSILICTDLDRTLLPNGPQPESPNARPLFAKVVSRPEVKLAFVSGRRLALQTAAIKEFDLPTPDFIVGDVGASIYQASEDGQWVEESSWHDQLAAEWNHRTWRDFAPLLNDISGIELQDEEAQSDHKLSYNIESLPDQTRILSEVCQRLDKEKIAAQLIWSVDETVPMGLLDVMAPGATKRHAVEHVIELSGVPKERVLFAGDSGNDLPILVSAFPSVLVANATPEFRAEASKAAESAGNSDQLHLAQGGLLGMNGCYAAGILEGLVHFLPETAAMLQ